MSRHNVIQDACRSLEQDAAFYDGMITCSTLPGRMICGLVWNMGKAENTRYLEKTLDRIPDGFAGKLLEVPVGTGALTMPVCKTLPQADITCLGDSPDMMAAGRSGYRIQNGNRARFGAGQRGVIKSSCKNTPCLL